MPGKKGFALVLAVALAGGVSPAFAQTVEFFGPLLPMQFDEYGARHYYVYGYYGPFAPSMPSTVVKETTDQQEHRLRKFGAVATPKVKIADQ